MKRHLVVKLRHRLPEPVPYWVTFIGDKSVEVLSLTRAVDAVLHQAGLEFWVTSEYQPAGAEWAEVERHHGLDRTYRLVLSTDASVSTEVVAAVAALPEVESAHQLDVAGSPVAPPRLAVAASVGGQRAELTGLDFAHALTRGRSDVTVAVLDTGVNLAHPELRGKVVARADFVDLEGLDTAGFIGDTLGYDEDPEDELGHGTHVAGIVAGEGRGMDPGVAPGCRLMAVRVLATLRDGDTVQGAGVVDNINPAIKWAVDQGADVINMSLGIRHTGGGLPHADVIRYALARGVTVVAASGNDGTDTKYYPGALPGVIAVGAVDDDGSVASFTSWGAPITVVAPGVNVLSSYARGTYAVASGTSQAAPFVSGSVALMKSLARDHGHDLPATAVVHLLRETSDRVDRRPRSPHAGYGLVNLTDSFKWLLGSLN